MSKQVLIPGPDHPITIEPTEQRVVVRRGDVIVADTLEALTLREASYTPVHYIPLADVDPGAIRPSDGATYCPFKGDASYYALIAGGDPIEDAIWTYEEPYEAVAEIKGRVAFYRQNVEIEVG
jgi:uncharacterized protein (DUF427 family)